MKNITLISCLFTSTILITNVFASNSYVITNNTDYPIGINLNDEEKCSTHTSNNPYKKGGFFVKTVEKNILLKLHSAFESDENKEFVGVYLNLLKIDVSEHNAVNVTGAVLKNWTKSLCSEMLSDDVQRIIEKQNGKERKLLEFPVSYGVQQPHGTSKTEVIGKLDCNGHPLILKITYEHKYPSIVKISISEITNY